MENVGTAIDVTNYYLMEGETRTTGKQPVSKQTPVFRNIGISNVTVDRAKVLIDIEGLPEMPIEGLHIHHVMGSGNVGLRANYTDDLELRSIQLEPATGPAFQIQHSANLEVDDVSNRKPLPDTPVIQLKTSPGAIIRNCRAVPGTSVFLSARSEEMKTLLMNGNFWGNAQKAEEEISDRK